MVDANQEHLALLEAIESKDITRTLSILEDQLKKLFQALRTI